MKICGITRPEDAVEAWRLGVWAIGFVFAPSPRRVSPVTAADLVKRVREVALTGGAGPEDRRTRCFPLCIGVFGEAPVDEIVKTVDEVGLDGVQLHGRMGPEAAEVRAALQARPRADDRPVAVIRAVPVDPSCTSPVELREKIARAAPGADLLVLDTLAGRQFGGTGKTFGWDLAKQVTERPFLIAGGIGPGNVKEAVVQSGAWGVDVSSGVESSPGVKDHQLMAELVRAAKTVRS